MQESYNEAVIALDYRTIKTSKNIILYEDIKDMKSCYYYPVNEEYTLGNYLKAGSGEEVKTIFNKLLTKNIENGSISVNAIKLFFINVELTAIKIGEEMSLDEEINVNLNDINNFDSIDDMKRHIEQLFCSLCEIINSNKKSDNTILREGVVEYINRNLTHKQLSLCMIADEFNISPSYFSRFFKEQLGCYFLEYVNRKRIEYAKESILNNKTIDINTLSIQSGYDNVSTFRRLFKKYEGVPPSQFKTM